MLENKGLRKRSIGRGKDKKHKGPVSKTYLLILPGNIFIFKMHRILSPEIVPKDLGVSRNAHQDSGLSMTLSNFQSIWEQNVRNSSFFTPSLTSESS